MAKVDEEKLLATLYTNFSGKGNQKNDWIFIAEKLKELKGIYNSDEKVATSLGLSREMVRSTIRLLDLPDPVKNLIRSSKISQDLGWRLLAIKDKKKMIEVAESIIDLSAHDARDMIRYAKNNPEVSIRNQIDRLKKSRDGSNVNVVITTLNNEDFSKLKNVAKEKKVSVSELISQLVKKL